MTIHVRSPDQDDRRLEFHKAKITVGSSPMCDITIAGDGVADEQAVLVQRGDHFEIFDIGHDGAVLVGGRPCRHGDVLAGQEIWIGDAVLMPQTPTKGVAFVDRGEGRVTATVSSTLSSVGGTSVAPAEPRLRPLLNEVVRLIHSIGRSENIFESILDSVFSSAPVLRAFLALRDPEGKLVVKAHRNREQDADDQPIQVSQTLVGKVLDSGEALLTSDAEGDPNLNLAQSIQSLRIKAAICVPLVVDGKVIGLLYGDNREQPGILNRENLAFLSALAGVAAVAVEKFRLLEEYDQKLQIEQALAIARSIHRNFLPAGPPQVEGFDVYGDSESCDATGGDYYDFFPLSEDRLGVVIADVAGHGIGPALLMASVRATLRALLVDGASLNDLLFRLNELISVDVRDGRFITLFFGLFDRKEGRMKHIGAGHTPTIWVRGSGGEPRQIRSGGPPLGVMSGVRYEVGEEIAFEPGDVFLFSTDGIHEAINPAGEHYGLERLQQTVQEHAKESAQEMVAAVHTELSSHVKNEPLRDDTTLVVVKIV